MKRNKIGILFVLIAGSLWGTTGIFVNYFNSEGLSSIDIAGVRLFVAAIIMGIYLIINDKKAFRFKIRDVWCFIGSGLISLMLFTVCYFRTIVESSMSVASVLLYTSPVFVIVFSFFFFKERGTKIKALSCLICVVGTVFVSGIIGTGSNISLTALSLGITSGLAYALYSIFSRFALEKGYSSMTITFYTFLFSATALLPLTNVSTIGSLIKAEPHSIFIIILTGLITAVLPYVFYTMGLERIESGKAAVVAAIEPVVANVIGVIVFGDLLSGMQYVGIIFVLSAIVLTNLSKK